MKTTNTRKNWADVYPRLSDLQRLEYLRALYCLCSDQEFDGNLPAILSQNKKLNIFHFKKPMVEFDGDQYLDGMFTSNQPHIRIIALYMRAKGVVPESEQIAQAWISRHVKPATLLVPWLDNKELVEKLKTCVVETAQHAKQNDYNFTLETVFKKLTS